MNNNEITCEQRARGFPLPEGVVDSNPPPEGYQSGSIVPLNPPSSIPYIQLICESQFATPTWRRFDFD